MTLLLLLLSAHFIGDFYLQPDRWISDRHARGVRAVALYKHSAIHGALAWLAISLAGFDWPQALGWALFISISHWLIDWTKAGHTSITAFVLDQAAHLAIVAVVVILLLPVTQSDWQLALTWLRSDKVLLYVLGYLVVLQPASIMIAQLLARHTAVLASTDGQSLGAAGRWIGYVERVLALSFILVGQYTGLGFLVATKTVFRVGDLSKAKDMRLTEYMMLGTLISFAIALTVGWLIRALV